MSGDVQIYQGVAFDWGILHLPIRLYSESNLGDDVDSVLLPQAALDGPDANGRGRTCRRDDDGFIGNRWNACSPVRDNLLTGNDNNVADLRF